MKEQLDRIEAKLEETRDKVIGLEQREAMRDRAAATRSSWISIVIAAIIVSIAIAIFRGGPHK